MQAGIVKELTVASVQQTWRRWMPGGPM